MLSDYSLSSFATDFIDSLLPPRCIQCGRQVSDVNTLCSPCWQQISFFLPPWCSHCGLPSQVLSEKDELCLSCLRFPKMFDICRSVFSYDRFSRLLIIRLKQGDRTYSSQALSHWMTRIVLTSLPREALHPYTLVIPVPTHPLSLLKRKFHHTAMISKKIAKQLDLEFAPDLMQRVEHNTQKGKGVRQRINNLRKTFALTDKANHLLSNRPLVILVDDVITTGATMNICAKLLKSAGVQKVFALTAARVPKILPQYPKWLTPEQ